MTTFKYILGPMRLPFLILTPACVVLGLATAVWRSGEVSWFRFILALIGAVFAHISVNAFNEYFDLKTGLDYKTERTPFSGGSGTLPERPEFARKRPSSALKSSSTLFMRDSTVTGTVGGTGRVGAASATG